MKGTTMTSSATFTLVFTEDNMLPTYTQVKIPFTAPLDFSKTAGVAVIGLILKNVISDEWEGTISLYLDDGEDGVGERLFEADVTAFWRRPENQELAIEFNATTTSSARICGLVLGKPPATPSAIGCAPPGSRARFVLLFVDDVNVGSFDAATYDEDGHTIWSAKEIAPHTANPTPLACGLLRGLVGRRSVPLEKDPEDVTKFKQMGE